MWILKYVFLNCVSGFVRGLWSKEQTKILDDPGKGEFIGSSLVFTDWQVTWRTELGIDRKPEGGSL